MRKLVEDYIQKIEKLSEHNEIEKVALKVHKYFPYDIGIFISMLLNYAKLKAGDSVIINPQEPHAYIYGDIIECKRDEVIIIT